MTWKIDVDRLMQALSEIMSDKYGLQITYTALPKTKEGNGNDQFT